MHPYIVGNSEGDLEVGLGVEVIASSPLEALRKYMAMGNPYAETMAVECPNGDVVMGMELLPDESRGSAEAEAANAMALDEEGGAQ